MPFRLGVVAYLNSLPLFHTLQDAPDIEIVSRAPADLTELLESRKVDAALLPLFEYLRGVGDALVPGVSIASEGAVASVTLFLRKPIKEVRSIAADRGSRSSVALLRILLAERFAVSPNISSRRPDIEMMLASFDAALLIGDAALRASRHAKFLSALDLGEEWTAWTRLPFVYAAWTTRAGLSAEEARSLTRLLVEARDEGYRLLDKIAREQEGRGDLNQQEVMTYLTENIRTEFGDSHRKGAEEFARLCVKHGLLASARPLRFC